MGEDTLAAQIAFTGSAMPLYKYFDIPGIDYLTVDLNWKHGQKMGIRGDNYRFLIHPFNVSVLPTRQESVKTLRNVWCEQSKSYI